MTFIEFLPHETEASGSEDLRCAYASCFSGEMRVFKFGQSITWRGKSFRELIASERNIGDRLLWEDGVFHSFILEKGRATLQVGAYAGFVFHTPPDAGEEKVGRVIEGGRESEVRPFVLESGG